MVKIIPLLVHTPLGSLLHRLWAWLWDLPSTTEQCICALGLTLSCMLGDSATADRYHGKPWSRQGASSSSRASPEKELQQTHRIMGDTKWLLLQTTKLGMLYHAAKPKWQSQILHSCLEDPTGSCPCLTLQSHHLHHHPPTTPYLSYFSF